MADSSIGATSPQSNTPSLADVIGELNRRHIIDSMPMETSVEADLCVEICSLVACLECYADNSSSTMTALPLRAIGRLVELVRLSIEAREVGQ